MKRKDILKNLLILAVVFLTSVLVPAVIRYVTDLLIAQIDVEEPSEDLTEAESGDYGTVSVGISETKKELPYRETENETETDNAPVLTEEQPETDTGKINPDNIQLELTETKIGSAEAFIGERKNQFLEAVTDYVRSLYGNSLSVSRIDVIEQVKDSETELVYQIEVFALGDQKEYSELFLSSYHKEWDFYSIYPYSVR